MKPSTIRDAIVAFIILTAFVGCGKKEAAEEATAAPPHDENLVTLTEKNLAQVEIKTEPVRRGDLEMTFKAAGTVTENLNKTAKITPTLEGRITSLHFDINDPVKEGDVLALLQTPELLGKPLELKAPIDGIITERQATAGELAGKETQIYTISDPADLWVVAEVKERDIAAVHLGEDATFSVLAYPERNVSRKSRAHRQSSGIRLAHLGRANRGAERRWPVEARHVRRCRDCNDRA